MAKGRRFLVSVSDGVKRQAQKTIPAYGVKKSGLVSGIRIIPELFLPVLLSDNPLPRLTAFPHI
jgi:hypothetical protein